MVPKLSDLIINEDLIRAIVYAIIMFCLVLLSIYGLSNTSDTKDKLVMERYMKRILEEEKDG
jgi:cell division protein FtsL